MAKPISAADGRKCTKAEPVPVTVMGFASLNPSYGHPAAAPRLAFAGCCDAVHRLESYRHERSVMLMTGKEYLESIRDGRVICIGSERVADQTTHPAFASGARTYAALFDLKSDPALRDIMTFEEGGKRYNMYYLQPRSQED